MAKNGTSNDSRVNVTRFSLLEQDVRGVKDDLVDFKGEFADFRTEVRNYFQSGQSKWRSIWPVVVTVGGLLWFVINQQIVTSNQKIDERAGRALSIAETNTAAGERRSDNISALGKSLATEVSQRRAKNAEIETQFRAFEGYANLTRVWENRILGMLWEKTYGQRLPEFQYYPTISQNSGPIEEIQ